MRAVLMIFRKTSDQFPKISEYFPKLFWRPDERSRTFSENFRKLPKMSKDFRRLPKTFEEDPKMFRWCTDEYKYYLRDKLNICEIIDIFTCENIISSHVRISYRFYQFVTIRCTTDFYIINRNYFMESACVRDFLTSWWSIWDFWYKTNECENPVQSAFHAVICLFHTYWDFLLFTQL